MTNHYKVTYSDPATGKPKTVVVHHPGQLHPAEVGAKFHKDGIKGEDFWLPGSALLKVENDDTPDPKEEAEETATTE